MKKIIAAFLLCFLFLQAFSQIHKKLTTYLQAQYNKTIYDATVGNNPSGVGLGLQTFFANNSGFKPSIEITADIYLEDDKILRLGNDHKPIDDLGGMVNLFAGSSYNLTQNLYLSFLAGPSFSNGNTYLGIKPSFGFFFCKDQKWTGKISCLNIFNRDRQTKKDFGSAVFSLGLKLF